MASRTRNFFLNALSLTLTAFLMRGVGMAFGVYVSNTAGSEAMGLFSLIGSVYGFAVTLGCAGISLGTTRLVSEYIGKGEYNNAIHSAKVSLRVCAITGGAASLLLFILAPVFGRYILKDERTVLSLQIMALTLVPCAVSSCLGGYFTAVRRVKVNSVLQVLIQLIKIVITIALLIRLVSLGTEEACLALVLGGAVSELISLFLTYMLYRRDRKKLILPDSADELHPAAKKLLAITLPVTASACIRSALTMIQHILIPAGLRASGQSHSEALSSYGALHGLAMPLVLFPYAMITAFAGLLIPEVSECCATGEKRRLERISYRAMTLTLMFSIGVSGIMIFYSNELGMLIYNSPETADYIRIMAPLIPVMYIDGAADAVLKGSGHQVYSMNVNIADALTSCIFAVTLIPKFGIWGYIISIYATEMLNTALSVTKMLSVSGVRPKLLHQLIIPIGCMIGATNISSLVFKLLFREAHGALFLILGIIFTVSLYAILLKLTGGLGKDEKDVLFASLMSEKSYNLKFRQEKT